MFPAGRTVICDAKTGQESAAHIPQVQIYMYLIPLAQKPRWRGAKFEGAVVYKGGREVEVPADSVDDAFISRVTEFMLKMTSDMPPKRVPILSECRFCELTCADCPDRIDSDVA